MKSRTKLGVFVIIVATATSFSYTLTLYLYKRNTHLVSKQLEPAGLVKSVKSSENISQKDVHIRQTGLKGQYFVPNPGVSFVQSPSRRISLLNSLSEYRIGNQLFLFASLYGIARRNNLTPIVQTAPTYLHKMFQLKVSMIPEPATQTTIASYTEKQFGVYDNNTERLSTTYSGNIWLKGYYQSWRYFTPFQLEVKKLLRFLPAVKKRAKEHLEKVIPERFQGKGFTRVGIHVRRGDLVKKNLVDLGYQMAPVNYFRNAMSHFERNFKKVIFIICSDDLGWTKRNLNGSNTFYSEAKSAIVDFTSLSLLDHTIMSVGTFGWWAAWLVNGTTIYYQFPFRNDSHLYQRFRREDHFPPQWIAMVG